MKTFERRRHLISMTVLPSNLVSAESFTERERVFRGTFGRLSGLTAKN